MRSRRRVRRPSKWSRPTEPQPKYDIGEIIDAVTISAYMGHSRVVPGEARRLACEHHWYQCVCTCGNTTLRTQQQLNDTRRRNACTECLSQSPEE